MFIFIAFWNYETFGYIWIDRNSEELVLDFGIDFEGVSGILELKNSIFDGVLFDTMKKNSKLLLISGLAFNLKNTYFQDISNCILINFSYVLIHL